MLTMAAQSAQGAFMVKRAVTTKAAVHAPVVATGHNTSLLYRIREKAHSLLPKIYGIENKKGIFGTLALVAGILSFIPIYGMLFGAAAIVLGCIGIRRHQKLAMLGLVLGCAGILANAIYIGVIIYESYLGFAIAAY